MDRRKSKINIIKHNRKLINPVCRIGIAYRAFLLGALFYYNREKNTAYFADSVLFIPLQILYNSLTRQGGGECHDGKGKNPVPKASGKARAKP